MNEDVLNLVIYIDQLVAICCDRRWLHLKHVWGPMETQVVG